MEKIELLSPAGDLEKLRIAYLYGADACYIGGKDYSLRANANNFSTNEIKEAVSFADGCYRFRNDIFLLPSSSVLAALSGAYALRLLHASVHAIQAAPGGRLAS